VSRLNTTVCLILCAALMSGCASMQGSNSAASNSSDSDSSGFYDGEPEVVFATEFPVESVEEAITRADSALTSGNMDLALYMYVRAYDLEKDNLHALMRIGGIHESRGNFDLAERVFTTVLRIDPKQMEALQSLGLIYLQDKRLDEAQIFLERAIAENPDLWRAQDSIGIIADIRGEHDKAIAAFDAALAVNPSAASVLNNRGYSLYLDGQYPEATRDFIAAAKMGVDRAWLNLGLVLARQERYSEAVHTMTRVVAAEIAYNDVGYIALRQGDIGIAETYFRKAIQIAPRYFEAAQRNLTLIGDGILGDQSVGRAVNNSEAG
jgi:tetratricopeptide (TPR) repeat protein